VVNGSGFVWKEWGVDLGFEEKVVVVTGASKGIGLAVVEAFAEEGARVVAGSRTTGEALSGLAERYGVVSVEVDLSMPEGPDELVERAVSEFGGIDVLVNNVGAGDPRMTGFLEISDEDWQRTFNLNLMSAVRASRAALPYLIERGGNIVNVSSLNARLPQPPVVDYAASKAAMTNLSKALSEEFGSQGVRVNAVSPGPVRTPFWEREGGFAHQLAQAMGGEVAAILEAIPEQAGITLGRFAEAEEVASLVVFLASDERAGIITGSEFVIDGGMVKTT
jgi:NAD(P)-dependent dehydrogenase (short-subunit alcohol dehydrogenase family)